MIYPKEKISFKDEKEKIAFLISLGFSVKNTQELLYKGLYTTKIIPVEVIGRNSINDIIIKINQEEHVIHPNYLLDMQKKDFIFKEKQESNNEKKVLKKRENKKDNEDQISLF